MDRPVAGSSRVLTRAVGAILLALLIGGLSYYHFSRNFTSGVLTADSMDLVQSARYLAAHQTYATEVVRPLTASYVAPNPDGSLPNLGQAPLYPVIAAVLMKAAHHTTMGLGDKIAVGLSFLFLLSTLAACYLLSRRLFGANGGAALAVLFCAFAGNGMVLAIKPHPATLAATLFTLLLWAVAALETTQSLDARVGGGKGKAKTIGPMGWAAGAGILFGLLYLTLYSALLLLPVFLFYFARTGYDRAVRARLCAVFVLAAVFVASPQLFRTYRLTGNPFSHARLIELVMGTPSYPGNELYRFTKMPESVPQFLATGGVGEIVRKGAANGAQLYQTAPFTFGVLLLALWAGSALIRFTDSGANRVRNLSFACALIHFGGLSLFLSPIETAPLLFLYAPIGACIGAAFLLALVQARRLPRFYARAAIYGWGALTCLPGLVQVFMPAPVQNEIFDVFYYLNTDAKQMQAVRENRRSLLVSDAPWEMAYRCDVTSVWLPADNAAFEDIERTTGLPIAGVALTPDLEGAYAHDNAAQPWAMTYKNIISLWAVAGNLPVAESKRLTSGIQLFYPPQLASVMVGYQPAPLQERNGAAFSLLFWNTRPAR